MQIKSRINRRIKYFIWAIAMWIVGHIIFISVDGLADYKGSADVAVILGNRVFADGTLSSWLKGRTDAALELYKQRRGKKIFGKGGISPIKDGGDVEGQHRRET